MWMLIENFLKTVMGLVSCVFYLENQVFRKVT